MKKLHVLISFLILMSCQLVNAQSKGLQFDLGSGMSIPKDQVLGKATMISSGKQINTSLGFFGKLIGFEIGAGLLNNPLNPEVKQIIQTLPTANSLSIKKDAWQSIFAGFGPVFRLGNKKLDAQLLPKLGWGKQTAPSLGILEKAIGQDLNLSFPTNGKKAWNTYFSLGTRIQYHVGERFGLHLKADYLAMGSPKPVSGKEISQNLQVWRNVEGFQEAQSTLVPLVEKMANQSLNVFNIGAGITYKFGKKREEESQKLQISCEKSDLTTPANEAVFLLQDEQRPFFSWQNPSPKEVSHYIFKLYDGQEVLYEEKTVSTGLAHGDQFEKIYQLAEKEEKTFSWSVATHFFNCEPITAPKYYFKMANRSGVFHDIFDLECDDPAYTPQGDLRFTGKISFFNNLSTSDPLIINTFSDVIIQDVSGMPIPGVALTNLTDCISSAPVPLPLMIPPGGTQTYCFEIVVPVGHSAIRSEAHGTVNGLPQMSTDQDDLPNCSCTICENWRFKSKKSTFQYVASGGNVFNALLTEEFQINGSAPIKEIKAEIVYVRHTANDPECFTCTKHDNDMGLFSFGNQKPGMINSNGNWANGGDAYKGVNHAQDSNHDDYLNQVVWQANNPNVGVDFSGSSHRFSVPINLPQPSSLSCCDHRYEVCVRYTFTDINCASCDYLACYKMSPKQGGGPTTGGFGTGTLGNGPKQLDKGTFLEGVLPAKTSHKKH